MLFGLCCQGFLQCVCHTYIFYTLDHTLHFVTILQCTPIHRPSDRVHGCGTAQFDQSRTIPHNFWKSAKSRTIWKDLVKNLIKSVFPSIAKVYRSFLGYLPCKTITKSAAFRNLTARADIKTTRRFLIAPCRPGH